MLRGTKIASSAATIAAGTSKTNGRVALNLFTLGPASFAGHEQHLVRQIFRPSLGSIPSRRKASK
jgi:hypothetical protein